MKREKCYPEKHSTQPLEANTTRRRAQTDTHSTTRCKRKRCSNCRMSERGHRNATQHTNATHAPRRLTCRSWKYFKDGRDLYPTASVLHRRVQTSLPVVRWPVEAVGESPTQSATLVELALQVYSSERHVRTLCGIQTGKGTWADRQSHLFTVSNLVTSH